MTARFRSVSRRVFTGLFSVFVVSFLVACSFGGSSTTTPTPTPTKPPMNVYKGDGFTISYPADWKATKSSTAVSFSDSLRIYNLTIGTSPNPAGVLSADKLADAGVSGAKTKLKDPQTENVAPTTSVGGETWSQRGVSGTSNVNGQEVPVEAIVLADNHPASSPSTKGFIIVYVTAKVTFSQAQDSYFLPMLHSFAFA